MCVVVFYFQRCTLNSNTWNKNLIGYNKTKQNIRKTSRPTLAHTFMFPSQPILIHDGLMPFPQPLLTHDDLFHLSPQPLGTHDDLYYVSPAYINP